MNTRRVLLLALLASTFPLACREKTVDATDAPPPAGKKNEAVESDQDFVGLTQDEGETLAKKRKLTSRLVFVDGKWLPATKDYRPNRINFEVENGRIVRTSRG